MKQPPTREQQKIIKFVTGPATVQAGAGSGKTTTLALRTGYLIDNGVEPSSIPILTYSRALTFDISQTLVKLLGDDVANQVPVMTIHAFAYHLVSRYREQQGLVRPKVLKQKRQKCLINAYAKESKIKLSELKRAFHDYNTGHPAKVKAALGKEKAALAERAYKAYSKYKKKHNKVDFEDMIGQALELLDSVDRSSLLAGYSHLMIDELQDIDGRQKRLIIGLSEYMTSTVLVGDPHQSIYKWRHALPRYWNDIKDALGSKQFALTESFRIPLQALPLVNNLGRKIDKYAPDLRSNVDGSTPVLVDLADQDAQYRWLKWTPKSGQ
jgi:DNA helicase II / ATP-dependent DNA helicase PcrA